MTNFISTMLPPLLFLTLLFKESHCSVMEDSKLHDFQTELHRRTTFATAAAANSTKSNAGVFYPIGYGADPTGAQDSSGAILAALEDAGKLGRGRELLPGISDLGGVIIDFQGGSFSISGPISFSPGMGNIVVQGGSLRASNTFPGNRHLIELWDPDSNNGIKYEAITFRDILFDSTYRGGGLLVVNSARIRVTNCFFLHFTTQGLLVQGGHETLVSNCFLGQHSTVGGDKGERDFSGTAIDLASTDNAITDTVIFSAATGIVLRGRANIVTGVHCYNKATSFGGVGILVKSAQNRISGSYLDFNSIVIEDPDQVIISDGFFLGDGNIVLKSVSGQVSGLNIVNNIFSGDPGNNIPIVELDGSFTAVDQVVIDHNVVNGMSLKSTVGKLKVAGNGTKWVADFGPILLFPDKIDHFQYSFYTKGGGGGGGAGLFPTHSMTNVSENVVVVESQQAVDAVVSVYVDQNSMDGEGNV